MFCILTENYLNIKRKKTYYSKIFCSLSKHLVFGLSILCRNWVNRHLLDTTVQLIIDLSIYSQLCTQLSNELKSLCECVRHSRECRGTRYNSIPVLYWPNNFRIHLYYIFLTHKKWVILLNVFLCIFFVQ